MGRVSFALAMEQSGG